MSDNPNSTGTAAAGPGIPAWLSSPAKLPWDIALKIADLAAVPAAEREDCADSLRGLVWANSGCDSRSLSTKLSPALSQAADAARALQAAVCNLSNHDREWLQGFACYDVPHVQELLRTLPRTTSRLATLLGTAIGRYSPSDHIVPAGPKKRGRKQGTVNDPAFHRIVDGVLLCVFVAGGELTLDKNFKTGTLIEVLNVLRPYLPKGVIPNVLPLGTIQKIKTAFSKRPH